MGLDCVVKRLYASICRDPDTGDGGLEPTPSEFHADGFSRLDNIRMGEAVKSAADRLVEIDYQGTLKYQGFANGSGTRRRATHKLLLRVGYFAGNNHAETHMIIAADDSKLGVFLQKLDNIHGDCDGLCLEKVEVDNSEVIKLDSQRYELQITLRVQVY